MDLEAVRAVRARLDALCLAHPDRHVGGPGNAAANELFAESVTAAGFDLVTLPFPCVDWEFGSAELRFTDTLVVLHVGPYSPPFRGTAPLVPVSSLDEVTASRLRGAIALIHGPLAAEQITPRAYPFYRVESHAHLLEALDAAAPAAIVAATDRTPLAAALHPFPLFEDADLGIPSAYLTVEDGEALLALAKQPVDLTIDSRQVRASAAQLIATKQGTGSRRVLVGAHIDSRHGTPGALDNAAGVAVLLAIADALSDVTPARGVELVPFNGEDNFAAYGEVAYLAEREAALGDVDLAINIDAVARRGDGIALSFYECSEPLRRSVEGIARRCAHVVTGPSWPMSDHMIFAMRGVPTLAITSTGLAQIAATVAHTPDDVPSLVDPQLVVETARFIVDVIANT